MTSPEGWWVSRRRFVAQLTGVAAALPVWSEASNGRRHRLGVLAIAPTFIKTRFWSAFHDGLREAGYVEDKNLGIDFRYSHGRSDRFPELALDLVRQRVDAMLVVTTPAALAAKAASNTIPVIFVTAIDPVGSGLAASLPRQFELVINVRTARTLGLTVPPTLLVRADHVVE